MGKNYIGGDTAQKKRILGGGDTAHTLLTRVTHGVGTPHNIERWEGGHRTYFVDWRNNWGGDTAQYRKKKLSCGWVGRLRRLCGGLVAEAMWWVGGGPCQEIIPLRGSILQADTCQILSLAENPRWSPSVAKSLKTALVGTYCLELSPKEYLIFNSVFLYIVVVIRVRVALKLSKSFKTKLHRL